MIMNDPEMKTLEEVIEKACKKFSLTVLTHNKEHGYAVLYDGKDMVSIEKNLRVKLKERGYYVNENEYFLNYDVAEWLRLDKLKYLENYRI